MRIVEVVPSLDVAGAERVAVMLAQGLKERGHDVTVVSLYDPRGTSLGAELADCAIPVQTVSKRAGLDLAAVPRLARLLAQLRPDVVHTHLHALKYVLAAWRGPTFHTVHTVAEREATGADRWVHRLAFRFGVEPVAIGQAVADSIHRVHGLAPGWIIANGIPTDRFRPDPAARVRVRAQLGLPGDVPTFLAVGRIEREKNHAALLAAFATPGLAGARLLIAGDGALRTPSEALAATLGLGARVQFLGIRKDIPELLAATDVFVLSSDWEGNPLSVMEAMAAGLPVIATTVGCVPELVSEDTGLLVPAGDVAALSAAMIALALDLPRARALGVQAVRTAVRFDARTMARQYDEAFAQRLTRGR